MSNKSDAKRSKIKKRVRRIVFGSQERPRLSVFRSNKEIYAQVINDVDQKTLVAASSKDKDLKIETTDKIEISKLDFCDNSLTRVVLPAPDGEDKIIITPSLSEGIKITS